MEYTRLGRSGVSVSRICLGTMNFGWLTDEADSFAIMDRAHDEGVNFFDTADVYGGGLDDGHQGVTEELLGRWFAQGSGRRERTVLATKVFGQMGHWPNEGRLSAYHVRRACEASLRRLGVDHIDLYQMHHIDLTTPWDEVWEAMEVLRSQGKITYVGSSNFGGWHLAQASERAAVRHLLGPVSEQSLYNLINRDIELEVLPAAAAYGIGVLPWSPLAGGLLGGFMRRARGVRRKTDPYTLRRLEAHKGQLEAFELLCETLGEEPSAVALAWLLGRPGVVAPVVGPRTMTQFEGSVAALDVVLEPATLQALDEIFPGHRPAPEDYAW